MAETLPGGGWILKVNTPINPPFFFGTTGQTVTVTISKNGLGFGATANSPTEIANGWYLLQLAASDVATPGMLSYHATASSGGPADWQDFVQSNIFTDLSININGQVGVTSNVKQNTAFPVLFFMTLLSTGAAAPGLTPTGVRTFGGGGFAPIGGLISEVGGAGNGAGWYVASLTASDTNAAAIGLKFSATTCNDTNISLWTQP